MRAIVLSGGGSKGSYQIGVWKALRKLKIDYDIVTGTSVGALNATFMDQKKYQKAIRRPAGPEGDHRAHRAGREDRHYRSLRLWKEHLPSLPESAGDPHRGGDLV